MPTYIYIYIYIYISFEYGKLSNYFSQTEGFCVQTSTPKPECKNRGIQQNDEDFFLNDINKKKIGSTFEPRI